MKKIIIFLAFFAFSLSQQLDIFEFSSDLYSKEGKNVLKKVNLELIINGRSVEDESHKIIDGLNVVIGSFYIEDLFTSKGKENFKKTLISYVLRQYSVEIDSIFIQKIALEENIKIKELVEALKKEGFCNQIPLPNLIEQLPKPNNKLPIFDKNDEDVLVIE